MLRFVHPGGLHFVFASPIPNVLVLPITYYVNQTYSNYSVSGTITTNGTIGTLTDGSIRNFDLTVTEGSGSIVFEDSSQEAIFHGNGVTATGTGLFFNYDVLSDLFFESRFGKFCF